MHNWDFVGGWGRYVQKVGADLASAPLEVKNDLAMRLIGRPMYSPSGDKPPAMIETVMSAWRTYPLPFFLADVPMGGAATEVSANPQIPFRSEELRIDEATAADFDITDVTVGNKTQMAQKGPMAAAIFLPNSVGTRLACDVASPGINVVLTVSNTDAMANHDFRAVFFGTAADRPMPAGACL